MTPIRVKVKGHRGFESFCQQAKEHVFTGKIVHFLQKEDAAIVVRDKDGKFVRCDFETLTAVQE